MPLDKRLLSLLRAIADYRVLTIRQLAVIENRAPNATHRSLDHLLRDGLILESSRNKARVRGRREKLVSLSANGVRVLRDGQGVPSDTGERDITLAGLPHVEHQLLLNWVCIQWRRIPRVYSAVSTRIISHSISSSKTDPDSLDNDGTPVPVIIRLSGGQSLAPDAVATITDLGRLRTVLFFVEVDMGTEPHDSARKNRSTIAQKILKYQSLFRSERYRLYESVWKCTLRGFRVLFVANTQRRRDSLCHQVRGASPREFFWVTDDEQFLQRGAAARIWTRGGNQDRPAESILGSHAGDDSLPPPGFPST